jgi:hypothetical protein
MRSKVMSAESGVCPRAPSQPGGRGAGRRHGSQARRPADPATSPAAAGAAGAQRAAGHLPPQESPTHAP